MSMEGFVPQVDDTGDEVISQVIGNKNDTNAGTSLYARMLVPAQNSASNTDMGDVIGNKTDTRAGNSLYSKSVQLQARMFNQSRVYPTMAAGVSVLTTTTAWNFGAYATVIPANAITTAFAIDAVLITSATSTRATHEVVLYASATEIGRIRKMCVAGTDNNPPTPCITDIQPANKLIRARMANSSTTTAHVVVSVSYRRY